MPKNSIISWTAMISGYTKIGCYGDALEVFRSMQMVRMKADWISFVFVLHACAQLGVLELGKWIHFYTEKYRYLRKTSACNALMEMYEKCGSMYERDMISWSTMIGGLESHGGAREVLDLFHEMQRSGVESNEIKLVDLLCACVHAVLCDDGLRYFDSRKIDYNIEPEIVHYGCLVDLLGCMGRLERSLAIIKSMPVNPESAIWCSLLSSCRTHCSLEIAVIAMEHLLELEPEDIGNYILLADIYADLGKWDGVSRMRKLIRSKSMRKTLCYSLIEINSLVQEFLSGDNSKSFSKDIHEVQELLALHQSRETDFVDKILE
ncbi:unnamed protein product [Withania somnifera]